MLYCGVHQHSSPHHAEPIPEAFAISDQVEKPIENQIIPSVFDQSVAPASCRS